MGRHGTMKLSQKSSFPTWKHLVLIAAAGIGVAAVLILAGAGDPFRTPTATVAIPTIGQPAKTDLALAAGARLSFALYAQEASFRSGSKDDLWLHVEVLAGDKVVAEDRCVGISGKHAKAGSSVGTTFWGGDGCELAVPEPGADGIRITTSWKSDGRGMSLHGVAVKVFAEQD